MIGVEVEFLSTTTQQLLDTIKTTNAGGEVTASPVGPFFIRVRVTGNNYKVMVTSNASARTKWDYIVDSGGAGTHTTLFGASGALQAAITAGGNKSIWMNNGETQVGAPEVITLNSGTVITIAGSGMLTSHTVGNLVPIGQQTLTTPSVAAYMFKLASTGAATVPAIKFINIGFELPAGNTKGIFDGNGSNHYADVEFDDCYFDMPASTILENSSNVNGMSAGLFLNHCGGNLLALTRYVSGNGSGQQQIRMVVNSDLTLNTLYVMKSIFGLLFGAPSRLEFVGSQITLGASQALVDPALTGGLRLIFRSTRLSYNVAGSTAISGSIKGSSLVMDGLYFETSTANTNLLNVTGAGDVSVQGVYGFSTVAEAGTFITIDASVTRVSALSLGAPRWATVYTGPAGSGYVGAHNILSAAHGDTLAASIVDGDILIGNVTPNLSRLSIVIPAANVLNVLGIANGELRPSWKTVLDGTNPADVAAAASPGTSLVLAHRDHVHNHPDLASDLHTVYLLAAGTRALTGTWVQSGAFGIYTAGAVRVGSSADPTNTTAGDLTAIRGLFGTDVALPSGGVVLMVNQGTLGNDVQRLTSVATNDDPTEIVVQNRVTTTDATVTTLHTFTVPASTTYRVEVTVIARRTGGAAGTAEDGAGYLQTATLKNVAGTATIIGAVGVLDTAEDQAAWDCTIDVTGATARVRVTGAVDNNVTWHMTARVWQVST
jgi:hypothetical protein